MPSYRTGDRKEGRRRLLAVNSTACRSRSSRVSCPCLSPCWRFSWRCKVGCMKVRGLHSYKRQLGDHNRMLGSCCSHTASCPTKHHWTPPPRIGFNHPHLIFLLVIAECSVTGTDWRGGCVVRDRSSVAVVCWLVALNISVITRLGLVRRDTNLYRGSVTVHWAGVAYWGDILV